jgi:hypothetical protein
MLVERKTFPESTSAYIEGPNPLTWDGIYQYWLEHINRILLLDIHNR